MFMNLNSHRKEIINRIVKGEIYDIYSFLESFGYLEQYKINEKELMKKFEEDEKNKKYKVPNIEGNFEKKRFESILGHKKPDFTEDDFIYVNARPCIDTPGCTATFNNREYKFSLTNKGIMVAKEYSHILEFVTLWQQLQKQGLIFEITKEVSAEDIALFYEIFPVQETDYYKKLVLDREEATSSKKIPEGCERVPLYDDYEDLKEYGVAKEYFWNKRGVIEKSTFLYYKKYPVLNELHLTTCKDFINKKIVATPLLGEYLSNNYQTEEEKKSKWALIGTWVAIGISFIMAGFSVFATFNVDPSNNNLINIQSQLEQISGKLNVSNEQQLNEILSELTGLNLSHYDEAELQDKLNSIIDELKEINKSIDNYKE